jgi:hypothetical protein
MLRQAFRRTALPLMSYYAITLAVPLANGAAQSDAAFVKHAITVLVVPPLAIVVACLVLDRLPLVVLLRRRVRHERPAIQRRRHVSAAHAVRLRLFCRSGRWRIQ